jgi:hypothetical protein
MKTKGEESGEWRVTTGQKSRTGHPPTPVFLQKSVQGIENKQRDCEKEGKESATV